MHFRFMDDSPLVCATQILLLTYFTYLHHLYLKRRVAKCRVPLRPVIGRRGETGRIATPLS